MESAGRREYRSFLKFWESRGNPVSTGTSGAKIYFFLKLIATAIKVLTPISPLFDVSSNQPWWQGQLAKTHSFGRSAVNQLVLGFWQIRSIFALANSGEALAALPTELSRYDADTFTGVGTNTALPVGGPITEYQMLDDLVKTWERVDRKL